MFKKILLLMFVSVLAVVAVFVKIILFPGSPEQLGDREDAIVDGVNFVGVTVNNLEQSLDFYSIGADLEPVGDTDRLSGELIDQLNQLSDTRAKTQLMKSTNAQLLFMEFEDSKSAKIPPLPVNGPGMAHVCFQVNSETQSYESFLANGGKTIGDPNMVQLNPQNPVEYAYVKDPNDIVVEIEHVDVSKLDLPTPPENDYRIRHISLATSNLDELVAFYSILLEEGNPRRLGRFFGFSSPLIDKVSGLEGSKLRMSWFQVRNLELEIFEYVSHPTERPDQPRPLSATGYNMIVFDVKDLDKARALFLKAGGKIVSDVRQEFGGKLIFGRDPDGNLIGLHQVSSQHKFSSKNFSDNGI